MLDCVLVLFCTSVERCSVRGLFSSPSCHSNAHTREITGDNLGKNTTRTNRGTPHPRDRAPGVRAQKVHRVLQSHAPHALQVLQPSAHLLLLRALQHRFGLTVSAAALSLTDPHHTGKSARTSQLAIYCVCMCVCNTAVCVYFRIQRNNASRCFCTLYDASPCTRGG